MYVLCTMSAWSLFLGRNPSQLIATDAADYILDKSETKFSSSFSFLSLFSHPRAGPMYPTRFPDSMQQNKKRKKYTKKRLPVKTLKMLLTNVESGICAETSD